MQTETTSASSLRMSVRKWVLNQTSLYKAMIETYAVRTVRYNYVSQKDDSRVSLSLLVHIHLILLLPRLQIFPLTFFSSGALPPRPSGTLNRDGP